MAGEQLTWKREIPVTEIRRNLKKKCNRITRHLRNTTLDANEGDDGEMDGEMMGERDLGVRETASL